MDPVILEVAINGPSTSTDNPHHPRTLDAIVNDAITCFRAGAAIVHNHVDQSLGGDRAAEAYLAVYRQVIEAVPDAILCCGLGGAVEEPSAEQAYAHIPALAKAGMKMAIADPGSMNFSVRSARDGTPSGSIVYRNSFDDTRYFMDLLRTHRLGPSISVFEPGFLRASLAWEMAGAMPPGALVKLYFGGNYNPFTHAEGEAGFGAGFGLLPSTNALAAYREMLSGSALSWAVAVVGGDVFANGLADVALGQGGHLRVGLEDYGGPEFPSNFALVEKAAACAKNNDRRLATPTEVAAMLGLPR